MGIIEALKDLVSTLPESKFKKKRGGGSFTSVIAERKVFLSKKKLAYAGKFRVNEKKKNVVFSESLRESSVGLLSSTGFGTKRESFNTLTGAREGVIEEQSRLFGKEFTYSFDFSAFRNRCKETVEKYGYSFQYKIF